MDADGQEIKQIVRDYLAEYPHVLQSVVSFLDRHRNLEKVVPDLLRLYIATVKCFDGGHRLYICGNGGSFADALHISGELMKAFVKMRGLTAEEREKFAKLRYGKELADHLQHGFPVMVLGANLSLLTALENDIPLRYIGFAQELYAHASPGDILLGISTSGNARNVNYAVTVARAKDLTTACLTGEIGGELAKNVDIAIKAPAFMTNEIQELHLPIYHTYCEMIEAHYFGKP
ncbi:SIS domain-containing protein [candidate division KSB1 bacterium]|nr:SIS domain-containing protein [candidate division KSB1 bacterium]